MKKQLFLSILCTCTVVFVYAQNVSFYAGGGLSYTQEHVSEERQSGRIIRMTSYNIEELVGYRSEADYSSKMSNTYQAHLGYFLQGGLDIRLDHRFSLRTGLGVHLNQYETMHSFSTQYSNETPYDTISLTITSGGCDTSIFDSSSPAITPRTSSVDLSIPVSFRYDVSDYWNVFVGAQLNTPLYAARTNTETVQHTEEVDGKTICTYTRDEFTNPFTELNYLRMDVMAGLSYRILDYLEISGQVNQSLQSVMIDQSFTSEAVNSSSGSIWDYKPLRFSLGVHYLFGNNPTTAERPQ